MTRSTSGRFYLLMGPSAGTGKTSCERELAKLPGMLVAVSHTTRPMRDGEVDGIHYHFVTRDHYDALAAAGEFVERNEVPKGSGKFYGLSRREVHDKLAEGDLVTVVDRYGYFELRDAGLDCCVLWTMPPLSPYAVSALTDGFVPNPRFGGAYVDLEELERRMRGQGRSPAVVAERLDGIVDELKSVAYATYFLDSGLRLDGLLDQARFVVQADRAKRAQA